MSTRYRLVNFQLLTRNQKLGRCATIHLPIRQTCPSSCGFKDNGCHAQRGWAAIYMNQLERFAAMVDATPFEVACEAAHEIESAASSPAVVGRPLRLTYSGDLSTNAAANVVAEACASWPGPVFAFSHAWRTVARGAWENVSVLASCETTVDGGYALKRGYAPAAVVDEHPKDGRAFERDGVRWIPCPGETRQTTCDRCRLCFDAVGLAKRRTGIVFEAHGSGKRKVQQLVQLRSRKLSIASRTS